MSFTTDIKNELCRQPLSDHECSVAELLGILLYGNTLTVEKIKLVSSLHDIQRRVKRLFYDLFDEDLLCEGNTLYTTNQNTIFKVFDLYGLQYKSSALMLNRAVVEEDDSRAAFLRGCFLSGGYMTAGKKGYHLELVTPHFNVSNQVSSLLYEMGLEPRSVVRRSNYVLYYKNSETIETFLTLIGASGASMDLMLKKVEKSIVNKVNRGVNCETANLERTIDASSRQIAAIDKLERMGVLKTLPAELQETARLRRLHTSASLSELVGMMDPPISKPGLSSRLKKLVKLSEEIGQ